MWGVSGMSKVVDCQKQLITKSEEKGFLTFDDIMDLSDTYSLSVDVYKRQALNIIIQGLICKGAKTIYISPFEHNAVTRTLHHFEEAGTISCLLYTSRCV